MTIAEKVCEMYSEGDVTLESCCEAVGININTFYQWACPSVSSFQELSDDKQKELKRRGFVQEIQDALKKAKETGSINYKLLLKDKSKAALLKSVQGYDYEEVTITEKNDSDGNLIFQTEKRVTKHIPPNATSIIFTLKNVDPENFGETTTILYDEMSKDRKELAKLSDEELADLEKELKEELINAEERLRERE